MIKQCLRFFLPLFFALPVFSQSSDSPYEKEYKPKEGMIRVEYRNKTGYLDLSRKEVITVQYEKAYDFRNGLAEVSPDGKKWGYINKKGQAVVPFDYEEFMYGFRDGYTPAKKDGKWGIINEKGKTVVPHRYDHIYYFSDGMAAVAQEQNDKTSWGFVNEKGAEFIPLQYENVSNFSEGMAAVRMGEKWGFIDTKGKLLIPYKYDYAHGFSDGLAAVRVNGKWGFIDASGNMVIAAQYDNAYSFKRGEAEVKKGAEGFYINKEGKRLTDGRWLLLFTKGVKMGEQYWYRGEKFSDDLNKKYSQGFSFTANAYNLFKPEMFVVMTKLQGVEQTYHYDFAYEKFWERIKEMNKKNRGFTSLSYGNGYWSGISTALSPGVKEVVISNSSYPEASIEKYRKDGYFISSIAYGDDRWLVAVSTQNYKDQEVVWYEFDNWNEADVKERFKNGYAITSMAKAGGDYVVVYTKGTGITEQLLLWSDEVPMREIKNYWDDGYKSYLHFYVPRRVTINKIGW